MYIITLSLFVCLSDHIQVMKLVYKLVSSVLVFVSVCTDGTRN